MRCGAATCDITNELGTLIQGATVGGVANSVRDPLEANAIYLSQNSSAGETVILLVSCDFGGLEPRWTVAARQSMSEASGVPARSILIGSTHTGGPSIIPTNYQKPVDEAYLTRLVAWLADLAKQAVANAVDGAIRYGQGHSRVGYNRRCCWADGTHSMFGDTRRADFMGLEGPDDPTHTAIGIESKDGSPIAILHANTAHPCTFYGADFYSADFPGTARTYLRDAMGQIPVLFFNGAQGDICTDDITARRRQESPDRQLARLGHLLAGETLRLLHENDPVNELKLQHTFVDMETPLQMPTAERLTWAAGVLAKVDAGESVQGMDMALAHGMTLLQKRFGDQATDTLPIHAIRLGDLAIVSQPCELFCQFGHDVRRRSVAPMTAMFGLTDGYHGYCPTTSAIAGGGYSADPIYWTRFTPDAGDRIVDVAARLVHQLWS